MNLPITLSKNSSGLATTFNEPHYKNTVSCSFSTILLYFFSLLPSSLSFPVERTCNLFQVCYNNIFGYIVLEEIERQWKRDREIYTKRDREKKGKVILRTYYNNNNNGEKLRSFYTANDTINSLQTRKKFMAYRVTKESSCMEKK